MALPNWNQPRLVFEAGSTRQRWHDSGYMDAYSLPGRIRRFALRGLSPILPPRCLAGDSSAPAVDSFMEGLSLPFVRKAVVVGRNDQRQKWAVVFIGDNAKPVAFLKYGEKEQARKRIVNEADALAGLPVGAGPELIKQGTVGSGYAFVMKAVEGDSIVQQPLSTKARKLVFRWVDCLSIGSDIKGEEHPAIGRRELPDELISRAEVLGSGRWPLGWQHGDAAPWNLRISPSGQVCAIDWEDAVPNGCPLFDLVYYVLQTHFFLRKAHAGQAFDLALNWLCEKGLSARESKAMISLSAYDAWFRWKCDGWRDTHPIQVFRRSIWDTKET